MLVKSKKVCIVCDKEMHLLFTHTRHICLHVFLISLGPLLQNSAVKNYCNAFSTSYVAVYTLKISLNRLYEILV